MIPHNCQHSSTEGHTRTRHAYEEREAGRGTERQRKAGRGGKERETNLTRWWCTRDIESQRSKTGEHDKQTAVETLGVELAHLVLCCTPRLLSAASHSQFKITGL